MMESGGNYIVQLPPEIILAISEYLLGHDLLSLAATCKALREITLDEYLWHSVVEHYVGTKLPFHRKPEWRGPASWRQAYLDLYPCWFLLKSRYWMSNELFSGALAVSQYVMHQNEIVLWEVRADKKTQPHIQWSRDPTVLIRPCEFTTKFVNEMWSEHKPLVQITKDNRPNPKSYKEMASLQFMITGVLPAEAMDINTVVWPPFIIPSKNRTRGSSYLNAFKSSGHHPRKVGEICENAIRVPQTNSFFGTRSNWTTWGSIDVDEITPTKKYPLRGMWAGDYNGHGTEFVAFLQPAAPSRSTSSQEAEQVIESCKEDDDLLLMESAGADLEKRPAGLEECDMSAPLHAVKVTGDSNVPRAEYTFYTDSLSKRVLRIASEEPFAGARVVRGAGQIAGMGFNDAMFTPSQIFIVSNNEVAMFWEHLGHITYFRRVDP